MSVDDPRNQGSPWSLPPITTDGSPLQLGGALQSPEMSLNGWNTNDETDFQSALQNLLNLAGAPVSDDPNQPDPVVVPPIYGRYHADVSSVTEGDDDWVDVLNLDPRLSGRWPRAQALPPSGHSSWHRRGVDQAESSSPTASSAKPS